MAGLGTNKSIICAGCGANLAPEALSCPQCHQLNHSATINGVTRDQLSSRARVCEAAGDIRAAIALWQQALELLPPESQQAATVRTRVATLDAKLPVQSYAVENTAVERAPVNTIDIQQAASAPKQAEAPPNWTKRLGPFGAVAVFLLKFKTLVLIGLTKFKFLLFGLMKIKTLLTMLASIGLYWSIYGWKFGLGFILGIYVHEMGHVWALRHFGLRASAPMFIPGFGALVSLYDSPKNPGEDARIGLAGPIWGAAAAIAFLIPSLTSEDGIWRALTHATVFINLFNLTPVWQLDGGRGFRALERQERLMLLGLMLVLWYVSSSGLFLILAAGAAYRIFWTKDHPQEGDRVVFMQFAGLLLLFGTLLSFIGTGSLGGQ